MAGGGVAYRNQQRIKRRRENENSCISMAKKRQQQWRNNINQW